jgi:protein gp37
MADQRDGGIAWTDETWNPVRGCSRVSEGCRHCYAEGVAARFSGPGLPYEGLARRTAKGLPQWTGEVRMVPEHMADPLRWKRPRRVFVNSMSDLFHEKLTDGEIDSIFRVMLNAPRHTFQILTKRAKRMLHWTQRFAAERGEQLPSHIHLGISAENQANFDDRAPYLRRVEAAVRFVSYEPAIGPLDMKGYLPEISWVIVGGESGRNARPFDIDWARSIIQQCRDAGAAPFVKQLGAVPFGIGRLSGRVEIKLADGHGGNPSEWPADLRIREFPHMVAGK